LNGYSVRQTISLFCEPVFEHLSYFSYAAVSKEDFDADCTRIGFNAAPLLTRWLRQGCFAHSINHPKLFVLSDLAQVICDQNRLSFPVREPHRFLHDPLLSGPVWPVYPEVARRLEINGSYDFKAPTNEQGTFQVLGLEEFIQRSFSGYSQLSEPIFVQRLVDQAEQFEALKRFDVKARRTVLKSDPAGQEQRIAMELQSVSQIVCEEEFLDPGR
jgi:hypothetical protein